MIQKIVCLRDAVADSFLSPSLERNYEVAKRSIQNVLSDKSSLLSTHATDFDFWDIGDFDTDTGIIIPAVPLRFICSVSSLKEGL